MSALAMLLVLATRLPVDAAAPCVALPVVQRDMATGENRQDARTITVASLNMAARPQIQEALAAWTRQRHIDLLLLQEVGDPRLGGEGFLNALSARLRFHYVYAPANLRGKGDLQGLAILSRYPIADVQLHLLTHYRLVFRSRCRIALTATVMVNDVPLTVVNLHLDTRINSKARVAQLAPLLEPRHVEGSQIIGGDFNTSVVRWIGAMLPLPYMQRQPEAVREFMTARGFHTPLGGPPTFSFLGIPLRLDWIFLKNLLSEDSGVDHVPLTDHRGVWVRVTR